MNPLLNESVNITGHRIMQHHQGNNPANITNQKTALMTRLVGN